MNIMASKAKEWEWVMIVSSTYFLFFVCNRGDTTVKDLFNSIEIKYFGGDCSILLEFSQFRHGLLQTVIQVFWRLNRRNEVKLAGITNNLFWVCVCFWKVVVVKGLDNRYGNLFYPSFQLATRIVFMYSSGPNRSVVLNKHGGWTICPILINVWSEITMWSDFSIMYKTHDTNFVLRPKITIWNA